MQVIEVEYECCGAKYRRELPTLSEEKSLLHNHALGDHVIGEIDAAHDAMHPECLPIPYMLTDAARNLIDYVHVLT